MQCCADKPTWGCIPQLFATFEPWGRHLKRVTSAKSGQKSEYYMLAFDWLQQTDKINWVQYLKFPCEHDLCRAMVPDCLGTLSWTLCQISALKEAIGLYICLWQHHISKSGYFKCTILFNICTISFLSYYDIGCIMFT